MLERLPLPPLALRQDVVLKPMQRGNHLNELAKRQAEFPRYPVGIEDILIEIHKATGKGLPLDFVFQLGWDTLTWQMIYEQNALAAFYVGANSAPTEPIDLQDAKGIISISASMNERDRRLRQESVSVVGVTPDSNDRNRVLQVIFNSKTGLATDTDASLDHDEGQSSDDPMYCHYSQKALGTYKRIPSNVERLGLNEPPITSAMAQAANHSKMFQTQGDGTALHMLWHEHNRVGLFVETSGEQGLIGRRERKWDGSRLLWQVPFPASLSHI